MWSNGAFTVTATKGPILDASQMSDLESQLGFTAPEMVFGSNGISIKHSSGYAISFNAMDALKLVDKTGSGVLQVAYADVWREWHIKAGHAEDVNRVHRPFDWTYSTDYKGTETEPLLRRDLGASIPFESLKQRKPIEFFDDVPLYEDELGDNGLVMYSAKVRVMEDELLLLARMYLRVDNVLFRVRDTRVYVNFVEQRVVRTYTEKEDTFSAVIDRIPPTVVDSTPLLRDPQWISNILTTRNEITDSAQLTN